MSPRLALAIEFGIIGLGLVALVLIFQPVSLTLFSIGCGLVVLAALLNNLLPMAQAGRPLGGVAVAGLIVGLVFCLVVLLAIGAAHLYGLLLLKPPPAAAPAPPAAPFWASPLVWGLAAAAAAFALLLALATRRKA